MNVNKAVMHTEWIDPDDAPELTDAFFQSADEYKGNQLIKRGRPKAKAIKLLLTVRYDADVVQAFKATGRGWQSRMNDVLRQYIAEHPTGNTQ
jgi:uncharacterized protein (DUF4415 family)